MEPKADEKKNLSWFSSESHGDGIDERSSEAPSSISCSGDWAGSDADRATNPATLKSARLIIADNCHPNPPERQQNLPG